MSDFDEPSSGDSEYEMDDSMRYGDTMTDESEPVGGYCQLSTDVHTRETRGDVVPAVVTESGLWDSVEGEEVEALEGTETEDSQEGMVTEWAEPQADLAEGEPVEEWAEQGLEEGVEMLEEETPALDETADGADTLPEEEPTAEEDEEVEWLMEDVLSEDGLQGDPEEELSDPEVEPAAQEEEPAAPEEEATDPEEETAAPEEEAPDPEEETAAPEEEATDPEEEAAAPEEEATDLEEETAAPAGAEEGDEGGGGQHNDSTEDLLRLLGDGDGAEEKEDTAPETEQPEEQDSTDEDEEDLTWRLNYIDEIKSDLAGKTLSRNTSADGALQAASKQNDVDITGKLRSVRKQTRAVVTEVAVKRRIEDDNSSQENQQKKQKTSDTVNSSVTTRSRIIQDKRSSGDRAQEEEQERVPEENSEQEGDLGQEIDLEQNGVKRTTNGSGAEDSHDDSSNSDSFDLSYEVSDEPERTVQPEQKSQPRGDGARKRVRFADLPPSSDYDDSDDLFDDLLDDVTSDEEEPPEYKFSLDVRSERAGEFLPLLGRDAAALLHTESDRLRVTLDKLARERAEVRERQREAARAELQLRARLAQLQRAAP